MRGACVPSALGVSPQRLWPAARVRRYPCHCRSRGPDRARAVGDRIPWRCSTPPRRPRIVQIYPPVAPAPAGSGPVLPPNPVPQVDLGDLRRIPLPDATISPLTSVLDPGTPWRTSPADVAGDSRPSAARPPPLGV